MRRFYAFQTLFWTLGLTLCAQTIIVERPVVIPSEEKYKPVEFSDFLHVVEGSSSTYAIKVTGFSSIERVISLQYNSIDITNTHCHLDNENLTIDDVTIDNLKANETLDFHVTLIVREKGKEEDTKLEEDGMGVKVYPKPTHQEVVAPSFSVFCGESGELLWTANGSGGGEWDYEWSSTENGRSNSSSFTHPSIKNNGESEKDVTVTLNATNYAPDKKTIWDSYEGSWTVKVLPNAVVTPTVKPNSVENVNKLFSGDSWDLSVVVSGGLSEGWQIEWLDADSGKLLGQGKSYKLSSSTTNEVVTRHIILHVSNIAPKGADPKGSTWFDNRYHYYANFYPIPEVTFEKTYPKDVLDGEQVTMAVKVSGSSYTDDYVLNCEWDGQKTSSYVFNASNSNNEYGTQKKVTVKYTFELKNSDAKKGPKELSHTFTVWPKPSVNLSVSSNSASDPYRYFQNDKLDLSASSFGGYRTGWKYVWKDESGTVIGNSNKYTLKCDEASDEVQHKHVTLTITNIPKDRTDSWYTKTYDYYADFYPAPIVEFDKEYPHNVKHGDKVLMAITVKDAQGKSVADVFDISCSWNKGQPSGFTYEFIGDNKEKNDSVKTSVTVDCNVELKGTGVKKTYQCKADFIVWPLPTLNADNIVDRVGCGGQTIAFSVISNGGMKDGWTFEWTTQGSHLLDVSTNTLQLDLNNAQTDGYIVNEYELRAVNTCDGEIWFDEKYPFNVTVYPNPQIPEDIVLMDKNRGEEVLTGIREGNELIVSCDECKGGYPNGWSYQWKRNNKSIGTENVFVEKIVADYQGNGKSNDLQIDYVCSVENTYNSIPWVQQDYHKVVKVYRKPQTPISLQRKGNGTSGTLIATCGIDDAVLGSNDYYLVFGYRDSAGQLHDVSCVSQQNVGERRWTTKMLSSEYSDSRNSAYVYALWKYGDGAEITSGLCLESHTDENWDGSTYNGTTRSVLVSGPDAISSISTLTSSDENTVYSVDGLKSNQMKKGLNIIRTKGGRVYKVMNK